MGPGHCPSTRIPITSTPSGATVWFDIVHEKCLVTPVFGISSSTYGFVLSEVFRPHGKSVPYGCGPSRKGGKPSSLGGSDRANTPPKPSRVEQKLIHDDERADSDIVRSWQLSCPPAGEKQRLRQHLERNQCGCRELSECLGASTVRGSGIV